MSPSSLAKTNAFGLETSRSGAISFPYREKVLGWQTLNSEMDNSIFANIQLSTWISLNVILFGWPRELKNTTAH